MVRPRQLLDARALGVELRQVVPAGLHGPDLIPPGGEGLAGVAAHAHVDQQRAAVLVQRHAAGVVVVVAVVVAARLGAQGIGAAAAGQHAHAGVPDVAGGGGRAAQAAGKGADFGLGKGALHVVEQVDAVAHIGGVQALGVGGGGVVQRGKSGQGLAAHPPAEQVFPHAAAAGFGAAVGKIEVPGAVHVHVGDVLGHVFQLGLPPGVLEHAGGQGAQQFQRIEQAQPRVAVILRALVAAAVLAVVFQEAVQAVSGLAHGVRQAAGGAQQRRGDQQVLGAPGGPVAHRFAAAAHPPEMPGAPGAQGAGFHLPPDAGADAGGVLFQFTAQQVVDHGQQGGRLGGEEVHHRAAGVGQGQLRRIPHVAVVGRQLPGAFLTDGPHIVGDQGQEVPGPGAALRHHQAAERAAAGEVGLLKMAAVAGMAELQPERKGQRRHMAAAAGGFVAGGDPAVGGGQPVPGGAVAGRGAGGPAARGAARAGGKQFSQHRQVPPWRRSLWRRRPLWLRSRRAVCAGRCGG